MVPMWNTFLYFVPVPLSHSLEVISHVAGSSTRIVPPNQSSSKCQVECLIWGLNGISLFFGGKALVSSVSVNPSNISYILCFGRCYLYPQVQIILNTICENTWAKEPNSRITGSKISALSATVSRVMGRVVMSTILPVAARATKSSRVNHCRRIGHSADGSLSKLPRLIPKK